MPDLEPALASFSSAAQYLNEDLRTCVVFGGAVVAQTDMNCGIKQGCPLRGTLFALCVDGLLQRVGVVPPRRRRVVTDAGDLSLVLRRLFAELGDLLRLFGVACRASLCGWISLLLCGWAQATLARCRSACGPRYRTRMASRSATTRATSEWSWGVGRGGRSGRRWKLNFCLEPRRSLAAGGASARESTFSVVSLLSYKAQLVGSGPQLPQVYRRATQRVTGPPWMCFNTDLMQSLDFLGLGCHIPALQDALLATFLRAAASEQRASAEGIGWGVDALASDDVFLALDLSRFREELIMFRWRGALVEVDLRFSDLAFDIERRVQRADVARLRAASAATEEGALKELQELMPSVPPFL